MGLLCSEELQHSQYLTYNGPDTTSKDREFKEALWIQEMKIYHDHLNCPIGVVYSGEGHKTRGVVIW